MKYCEQYIVIYYFMKRHFIIIGYNQTKNKAQCNCIPGFTLLNIKGGCVPKPLPFRTDFPRPDIVVNCPTDDASGSTNFLFCL